jgi:hypothetical protein
MDHCFPHRVDGGNEEIVNHSQGQCAVAGIDRFGIHEFVKREGANGQGPLESRCQTRRRRRGGCRYGCERHVVTMPDAYRS